MARLDTTLCDKVCQWFSPGVPVSSSSNNNDCHDITEIFLKMVSNTIIPSQIIEPKKDHDIYDVENTCFLSFK
jgi:hypothetical protein